MIEIKGTHFFKEDGSLQNPFDHSQDAKYETCHQFALLNGVTFWKYDDVKFALDYVEENYLRNYMELFKLTR